MEYKHILESDEQIEMIVNPKKGFMLHSEDIFKIIAFFFMIFVAYLGGVKAGNYLFLIFGLIVMIIAISALTKRYTNTLLTYIITNKRVVFLKGEKFIKSKYFKELKSASYENAGKNRGYIILGESAQLFAGRGISFVENEFILDNLINYTEVSNLLKNKIK